MGTEIVAPACRMKIMWRDHAKLPVFWKSASGFITQWQSREKTQISSAPCGCHKNNFLHCLRCALDGCKLQIPSYKFVVWIYRRNHHGRGEDRGIGKENSLHRGTKFIKEIKAPADDPAFSATWPIRLAYAFYLFPQLMRGNPCSSSLPSYPFLFHFIPNQYYLTTYGSAMMAVVSAVWKLQRNYCLPWN